MDFSPYRRPSGSDPSEAGARALAFRMWCRSLSLARPGRGGVLLATLLLVLALGAAGWAQEAVTVKMSILPGLKFDQTRFAVPPGAKVTVKLSNPDQMIHNLVITEPGARAEIVAAALALGADGPAKNFVPESKKVLWHTKAINPGESTELSFTAPAVEGVYPYVCTSMGHGFVMYGAMYVTTKALPPLESDPNVPPTAAAISDSSDFSHTIPQRPVVSRTFLPDCGPAAIAVGLPTGDAYVFDAGLCRLRYAWKGGFVDNGEHWAGKGESFGKPVGHIYYRAPGAALIRIGDREQEPAARWRGYEMGKDGPTFHYTLNGCEVSEAPQALPAGTGVAFQYAIKAGGAPVYFVTDPAGGAVFTSSAGRWSEGLLTLTAEEAASFTLTMKERPGVEPLRYWSMNDLVFNNRKDPQPGVVGRAFTPGGTDGKPRRLAAGVKTSDLRKGATLMAWVRLAPLTSTKASASKPAPEPQPVFSAGDGAEGMILAAEGQEETWFHVALTLDPSGRSTLFRDGHQEDFPAPKLPEIDAEIYIGSLGEKGYLRGLLDEVRIYDRPLTAGEIASIYQRESASLKGDN